jgi:CheY-like chemotaxis protein
VLLDLMLPDNEGPELFETFRAETDAALVGISARSSVSDRIAGLKMGADDYVTKPFALEELMARVEAVIRRHRGKGGARLVSGDVVVDLSEGRATRADRQLGLTGIEFRILAALMRSSGQLVTYAQLALGKETFVGVCAKCHGLAAQGGYGPNIAQNPLLRDRNGITNVIRHGVRKMPAVGDDWSQAQLDAMVAYLHQRFAQGASGGGQG